MLLGQLRSPGHEPGPPRNRTLRAQACLEEMSIGGFADSWEGEKSCPPSVYFHGGPELAECQILSACQSLKHSYEEFSLSDVLMPEGCAKHPTSRSCCRGSGKVLGFPPVGGLIKRGSLSHIQRFQSKSSVLIMPPKGIIIRKAPSWLLSLLLKVIGRHWSPLPGTLPKPVRSKTNLGSEREFGAEDEQTS